jgi:hypothetical protein
MSPAASPDRGTEVAPLGDPAALKAEAEQLYADCYRLGNEADTAMARSEILITVEMARLEVQQAEAELASARTALAEATAAYDPVAADLARVEQELSATHVEGNLDQRLAQRLRRAALAEELEQLRPVAGQLKGEMDRARNNALGVERDYLPHFRAELGLALAAYDSPPLYDFGALAAVAPFTARHRAARVGLALMLGKTPADWRTLHGRQIRLGLEVMMGASGLTEQMHSEWLAKLKSEVGPKNAARIEAAYHARELLKIREQQPRPELTEGKVRLDGNGVPVTGLAEGFIEIDPATGQPPAPTLDQFATISPGPSQPRSSPADGLPQPADLSDPDSVAVQQYHQAARRLERGPRPGRMTGSSWASPYGP